MSKHTALENLVNALNKTSWSSLQATAAIAKARGEQA